MQVQKNYDVLIVGSGVGGSVLAAHTAERGVNPKNGERLRVAMLEAGPYWRGEPQPGYGLPLRRQMITNFISDSSPHLWPWGMVKLVGGTAMHAGASVYLPYDVDYKHWVDEGTDWTEQSCRKAGAEVTRMYHIHTEPDELLTRGNLMFRETVRAMGREVHSAQVARKNCLYTGFCEGGYFCRYDSRMTPLTNYIPLAEKHGLEIISDAMVERVIIEKTGARPVAKGVVFRQKGKSLELRASKIIVSAGVVGTPLLLFRSGYGSKEDLGSNLTVENKNIGKHLDIHAAVVVSAYFDEPIKDGTRGAAPAGFFFLDDAGPNGYGRLRIKDSGMLGIEEPWMLARSPQAPDFGREHKQFMKVGRMHRGGILVVLMKPEGYRGRINLPDATMEYEGNKIIERRLREGGELAREVLQKMGGKKIAGYDMPPIYHIAHGISTCKAGSDPKSSVVNVNFESHDVENLFICDASVLPRSASGDAIGPIATVSVLAAERIVANHFQR
ncbi:MAG TPA: GMC family oxidoreductase [Pyrinomonadaceae bacterium]|nr:GMC family oxidoreductase [Pyrinomonadaceae bacterium]